MKARQKQRQDNQSELGEIRNQDSEEYAAMKVRLETEIQGLEQQLEEVRAHNHCALVTAFSFAPWER